MAAVSILCLCVIAIVANVGCKSITGNFFRARSDKYTSLYAIFVKGYLVQPKVLVIGCRRV